MDEYDKSGRVPPKCKACGAVLKPSIIFFGEAIPYDALSESNVLADTADVVIVAGTSAVVYPAAAIPDIAKRHGAFIIESNLEKTGFTNRITDVFLHGPSGVKLPELVKALRELQ
jgi:NAD-dependent deacetylase